MRRTKLCRLTLVRCRLPSHSVRSRTAAATQVDTDTANAACLTCDGLASHILPHKAQHRALGLWDVVDVPGMRSVGAQHAQLARPTVTHGDAVAGVILVACANGLGQFLYRAKVLLWLLLGALEQAGCLALCQLLHMQQAHHNTTESRPLSKETLESILCNSMPCTVCAGSAN